MNKAILILKLLIILSVFLLVNVFKPMITDFSLKSNLEQHESGYIFSMDKTFITFNGRDILVDWSSRKIELLNSSKYDLRFFFGMIRDRSTFDGVSITNSVKGYDVSYSFNEDALEISWDSEQIVIERNPTFYKTPLVLLLMMMLLIIIPFLKSFKGR